MNKCNYLKKKIVNKIFNNKQFIKYNFWESKFKNVEFKRCLIQDSIFCDSIFENVIFENCQIINSNFSHTNFLGSKMKNPYIIKCNFRDAQKDKYSKIPNVKLYSEEKNKSSLDKKLNKLERGIYYSLTKGKGYHVIKNYFSKKKINKAFQIVDKVVMNDKKIKLNSKIFSRDKRFNQKWVYNLLSRNKVFVDLIQPKIAMNVFKKLLGTNFLCGFFGANCLLPGARGQLPHLDYPYYRFVYPGERVPLNGKNNFFLNCQILIPLTKFDKENGSTGFLKNTHKLSLFPKENYHFKKKFTQLKLDVGTLVIFNGLIWHLAKPNYSEKKKRYGILGEYIPEFIAPLLDLKKITKRKIISDDKKFLRQLLGVDLKFPSLRK